MTEPTLLFSSTRLKVLMNSIHESTFYDYILIDTPPTLICSDASLISRCCSTSFYIVSLRNVKKNIAIEAAEDFASINDNCLGLISNSTNFELVSKDNYSKGYSSYYGNSSMFQAFDATSNEKNPVLSISAPKRLINIESIPFISKKTIESAVKLYKRFKNWLIN